MFDYFQLYLLLNLLCVVWVGLYSATSSLAYQDRLNSLLGTIAVAFFGMLLVLLDKRKK